MSVFVSDMAIQVRGLVKAFGGKTVVNGVDLDVPQGQVWGFLGPNGSGKTTTIRMMCGLLKPTGGSGKCLGYDILKSAAEIKRRTGYMTQKFSFWEDLSIRENLMFVARMYDLPRKNAVVDETLTKLGLTQRQHQLAGALSGGWKQRLALAAVTMHAPKLLLLDEPTAGVDPQARREFWDEIHELASSGMTVLVSTHYMDEAERCDKIAYLAHGNLITQGRVQDVIDESRLVTFAASGADVRKHVQALTDIAGVDNASYFGSALHVSGTHRDLLEKAVNQPEFADLNWQEIKPDLEDVFIALMRQAGVDARKH
ncbi:ABC transporter ATP-binding protein [Teredinibacter turnerae]|uniref:ABC transporter ATP-binding protein n=1 Tax=Teredinibacter turnerae TaxID=2426 RepID=UPI0003691070|nr:ABC transporter ATP-binding protein [Teredinibacter turnerae]